MSPQAARLAALLAAPPHILSDPPAGGADPAELEKHFVILEHELPGRDALAPIAAGVATEPGELPEDKDLNRLLDAAAGLTRQEA